MAVYRVDQWQKVPEIYEYVQQALWPGFHKRTLLDYTAGFAERF